MFTLKKGFINISERVLKEMQLFGSSKCLVLQCVLHVLKHILLFPYFLEVYLQ